jgi:eukaryotic-like serine/threonine-protein kinase
MTSSSTDLRDRLQLALANTYTIERELGGGGMSRVFRARDDTLGRDVVIKVLTSELAQELSAERFEREVRVTAQLQHPHIVPVITAGVTDARPYYVMPFVAGESLRARLASGTPLGLSASVKVLSAVAQALDYAHRRGVVHRDIKPENILLSDGIAVVTDFGIAKAIDAAKTVAPGSTLTQLGTSIGTPAYMAPEQAAGDPATDHRADIYAWGVVAYELLSGHHPFESRTSPQQLLAAHMSELPAPLRRAAPDVSPALDALVMRCLEKDPSRRPDSAAALVDALSAPRAERGLGRVTGMRRSGIAIAAILVIGMAGSVAWRWRANSVSGAQTPGAHTLAVLPFANLSGDTTQQYFADGLADELTTALGQTPGLHVTARSAAFAPALRSLDAMAAGRRLDVATVLEGAVRRSGPRIRLSAELVGVHDGTVLWSDEFEHDGGDVFAAQDDLTHRVAAALHDRLAVARARATSFDRGTSDEVAYDLYLQARYLFARRGTANLLHAAALLAQAIHRDSTFARAMATLAMVQVVLPEYTQLSAVSATADGPQTRDTMITAGLRNAARAIARDSTLADAYVAQGYGLIARWDWDGSETSFRRALALEPLNPEAYHWHADLLYARGDIDGALNEQRRSQQLDPTSAIVVAEIANELYDKHLYAEAIATGHRASAMDPLLGFSYLNYAPAFILMGYPDSAMDALAAAERLDAGGQDQQGAGMRAAIRAAALTHLKRNDEALKQVAIVEAMVKSGGSAYTAALARMGIGDREGALRWLTRSIDAREEAPASWGVSCDPMFDPLKSDPRFGVLMARMKVHVCPPGAG